MSRYLYVSRYGIIYVLYEACPVPYGVGRVGPLFLDDIHVMYNIHVTCDV